MASYINDRPDSALAVLRGIDRESLLSRKDRARTALLHSIALDKCYVDITSDSILAPALAYYRNHGSANQRLKARYYRAVLARNAGDRDTQMAWLVEAERFIPRARDPEMAGFIYAAKRELYLYLLDLKHAEENARSAVSIYEQNALWPRYYNAVISLTGILQMQNQYEESARWITLLKNNETSLTPKQLSSSFALQLDQDDSLTRRQLPEILNDYMAAFPDGKTVFWLTVADAWRSIGNFDNAEKALIRYQNSPQFDDSSPVYWLVASRIHFARNEHEQSNTCYQRYSDLVATRRQRAIQSEARFVPERASIEASKRRDGARLVGFVILSLLLIAALSVLLYRRKKEAISLDRTIRKQDQLIQSLSEDLQKGKNKTSEESRTFLKANLERISKEQWSHAIQTDHAMLKTIREAFSFIYPKFMKSLHGRGMKNRELDCCCLFILGFTRKEQIGLLGYKNPESIYNLTTSIRKKLRAKDNTTPIEDLLNEMISAE